MSDHDWQAPGGPAPAPNGTQRAGAAPTGDVTPPPLPPDAPTYGPPGAYPPDAPTYGPPGAYPPPGAGGWAPPPKPGLLPLRPMGFGTLLWAPFRTLRRNPAATFGSGLVVQLVTAIATAAVVVPFLTLTLSRARGRHDC